ncbi:MAG: response regulator [Candidatus Sericytochromatia bacterium]
MASRRILIIDDEADIREVALISLEMVGGWTGLAAPSGEAGLAIAQAERPDAILLDMAMPLMDGPATLAALRADPATRDIPVILLTAQAAGQAMDGLQPAAVIAKPFDPMTLPTCIAEALGWEAGA